MYIRSYSVIKYLKIKCIFSQFNIDVLDKIISFTKTKNINLRKINCCRTNDSIRVMIRF